MIIMIKNEICVLQNNNTMALTVLINPATVMSLFMNLCSVIRNDYAQEQKKMRSKADKKLLRMIRKKEISLGYKYDDMADVSQR